MGNIAGDSPQCRNIVLKCKNGLKNLLLLQHKCIGLLNRNNYYTQKIHYHIYIEVLRSVVLTLSNMCRGKLQPDMIYIKDLINALTDMLSLQDVEILPDTCWGFSYLTDIMH